MKRLLVGLAPLLCLLAAACEQPSSTDQSKASGRSAPPISAAVTQSTVIMPIGEVMHHVLDPAAYAYWGAMGTVYDENGEHEIRPITDEDWEKAENGVATVGLAAIALTAPDYVMEPKEDWNRHAVHVSEVALEAKQAVEKRDMVAVKLLNHRLDEACEECHKQFSPPSVPPKG